MTGTELIVKIIGNKSWIADGSYVKIDALQLDSRPISSPAYIRVLVTKYFPEERRIHAKVVAYFKKEGYFDAQQQSRCNQLLEVNEIDLLSLSTEGLLLLRTEKNKDAVYSPKNTANNTKPAVAYTRRAYEPETTEWNNLKGLIPEPKRVNINETFTVSFAKLEFRTGCVAFTRKFKDLKNPLEIIVYNEFIKEEYDAVKEYFANVLGKKKIQVTVKINGNGENPEINEVQSPEIEKINDSYLEKVKLNSLKKSIGRQRKSDSGITLQSLDSYTNDSGNCISAFYHDSNKLIEDILKITNAKHYRHLKFLAGKHDHQTMKLRIVNKPFSFLFLLPGSESAYFVWETINTSEASYIWRARNEKRELKNVLEIIKETINQINETGKMSYLSQNEENFTRILHDYKYDDKGFLKWKEDLEKFVV